MMRARWSSGLCLLMLAGPLQAAEPLTVVEDVGGHSAQPYYRALNLPDASLLRTWREQLQAPAPPEAPYSEAQMLPVRSHLLRPGHLLPRTISAPGQRPIFLVGDDSLSRTWLQDRLPTLRRSGAIGFVVEVESKAALENLRKLAPGLMLVPASGDELARRLRLQLYPVLITATRIEQ